jgi:protocatechuate 3,4-dioxygenase alpha subunit
MSLLTTASQTVGPYVLIGFEWMTLDNLAPEGVAGERVSVQGRVLDADRKPVADAIVEIWQADSKGQFATSARGRGEFRGFGRIPTNDDGAFRFTTIKPGRVAGPDGRLQAAHLAVGIFMRGQLLRLNTRMYFPDAAANADDPILALVPPERRETLIARASNGKPGSLTWDVILQGERETVFFDY